MRNFDRIILYINCLQSTSDLDYFIYQITELPAYDNCLISEYITSLYPHYIPAYGRLISSYILNNEHQKALSTLEELEETLRPEDILYIQNFNSVIKDFIKDTHNEVLYEIKSYKVLLNSLDSFYGMTIKMSNPYFFDILIEHCEINYKRELKLTHDIDNWINSMTNFDNKLGSLIYLCLKDGKSDYGISVYNEGGRYYIETEHTELILEIENKNELDATLKYLNETYASESVSKHPSIPDYNPHINKYKKETNANIFQKIKTFLTLK